MKAPCLLFLKKKNLLQIENYERTGDRIKAS